MTQKNRRLVMIGAGGHAKVCYDIARLMNNWDEILILDDQPHNDYFKISGPIDEFYKYNLDSDFFVAIGDNELREKITKKLYGLEVNIVSLIHPQAIIAENVKVSEGTVVMPGVVINSSTVIKESCIINTSVSIDHDNIINKFVHISPGSSLAGNVIVGSKTWIGTGVNVINNVRIAENSLIGAGSTVINNILEKGVYVGTPAEKLER